MKPSYMQLKVSIQVVERKVRGLFLSYFAAYCVHIYVYRLIESQHCMVFSLVVFMVIVTAFEFDALKFANILATYTHNVHIYNKYLCR